MRRCGETGGRFWKTAEVDHRIPLFRVWREYRDAPWPKLLGYWGLPNLQVINREATSPNAQPKPAIGALHAIRRKTSRSLRNASTPPALTTAFDHRHCAPRWRWPSFCRTSTTNRLPLVTPV